MLPELVKRVCRVLGCLPLRLLPAPGTEQARAERRTEEKRTVSKIRAIHAWWYLADEMGAAGGILTVHYSAGRGAARRRPRWTPVRFEELGVPPRTARPHGEMTYLRWPVRVRMPAMQRQLIISASVPAPR